MNGIFLSHSSADKTFALELASQIESSLGFNVFVSSRPDAIPSGNDWQDDVIRKLENSSVLVVLITRFALESVWVGFEVGFFWKKTNGNGIHVLYHPKAKVPSPLNTLQAKLITNEREIEDFIEQLCRYLQIKSGRKLDASLLAELAKSLPIESEAEVQKKSDLIAQLRSKINHETIRAAEELRRHNWLKDGSLKNANLAYSDLSNAPLSGANLEKAYFGMAILENANLSKANLEGAEFFESNLRNVGMSEANLKNASFTSANLAEGRFSGSNLSFAHLYSADLQDAWLPNADLRGAYLRQANLKNTSLKDADLRGADLSECNLEGANLRNTILDTTTILPDGSNWNSDTDMHRFTDSENRDFWRSNNLFSPAFMGTE